MPLKGKTAPDNAAGKKAAETFARLERSFGELPSTTETISFRVPRGEKSRLRVLFAREGKTLAEGVKAAVYEAAKKAEEGPKL
jgi:hypothetical protein